MDYHDNPNVALDSAQLFAAAAAAAGVEEEEAFGGISFDVCDEDVDVKVNDEDVDEDIPNVPTLPVIGVASWPGRGIPGGGACVPISNGTELTSFAMPFEISHVREKNVNGALLCLVVGCTKNAQGRSTKAAKALTDAAAMSDQVPPLRYHGGGGFCRSHHNAYLIQTGQVESWDCACGNRVVAESDRCGLCHRWKGGVKRSGLGRPPGSSSSAKKTANTSDTTTGSGGAAVTMPDAPQSMDPDDIQISNTRETNNKGRSLCKVVGCVKLDQARNEGFCRKHYRLCAGITVPSLTEHDSVNEKNEGGDVIVGEGAIYVNTDNWICPCGQLISYKQKRCGKCNKWKGGMREPYKVESSAKKPRLLSTNGDIKEGESSWICHCGSAVSANKARCGTCHHWRGGKRKGGWTIRPPSNNLHDDKGIDWTVDWSCCGETISAAKRRCGKCNGWRGGKRVAKTLSKSDDEGTVRDATVDEGDVGNEWQEYKTEENVCV